MRFAVVGAGAIGSFVGASLMRGGADVVLIARGEHLAALRGNGLRVLPIEGGELAFDVEASGDLAAITSADVVIVALKAHAIAALAPALGELLAPGTPTVWAQNGIPWWYFQHHGGPLDGLALESVDPGGVIAGAMPRDSAIGIVMYCSAAIVEPGVVRVVENRRFPLGEPDGQTSERCGAISEAMRAGGLEAPVVGNVRDEIWSKLLGNATFNPVSALTGATLRQFGDLVEMRMLMLDAFDEIAAVARALGAEPTVSSQRRLAVAIEVGDHKTSMLQDLEAGRPLEYQCMTGAVIEIARHLGIELPRLEAIHACVALLDHRARAAPSS